MPGIEELEAFRVCRRACLDAVRRALDAEGPALDDAQLGLLLDGAEVCETTIRFRRRNFTLDPPVCAVCVEVCQRCAALCEALADDSQAGGAPPLGPGRMPWSDQANDGPAHNHSRRTRA
jgi:hypothetical protein